MYPPCIKLFDGSNLHGSSCRYIDSSESLCIYIYISRRALHHFLGIISLVTCIDRWFRRDAYTFGYCSCCSIYSFYARKRIKTKKEYILSTRGEASASLNVLAGCCGEETNSAARLMLICWNVYNARFSDSFFRYPRRFPQKNNETGCRDPFL